MLKKSNKRKTKKEYSKTWITTWQFFVMFWCSVYFIVDIIFNKAEHSVELCLCLVTSIAAIFIPYLAKSYFGKRNEEENKMIMQNFSDFSNLEEDDFK